MGVLAKGIGIFVVIVIIAIAVSWIGNPQNESQNESQNELQNEKLNDNIIQVRVATIPSYADKEMVENSIDASLYRWERNTTYKILRTFENEPKEDDLDNVDDSKFGSYFDLIKIKKFRYENPR